MLKSAFLCGGSALAVAASLYGSQVLAADASASGTAAESSPSVGELVVVAEKREQRIESVPVAITAFSAQQRSLLGIQTVEDLAQYSPGLSWTDIDDRIYIRGIGRNSDNLNNTSGVAIYYNGIYYGANAAVELQKDDLFVGNIEVDNGPQNTLHGSNADGGLVQYTSQRPTNSLYAEVRTGVANYGEEFVEGVISGPIDDHWKFRVGGNFTSENGGFFNNLDGAPQGGNLVLGGSGQTEYYEGQLEGHWDHFDLWTMVSSGNFAANSKGAAAIGNIPLNYIVNGGLQPSGFYGLCGIAGVAAANATACASGPPVVPGSLVSAGVTANNFPGNNPGNLNPRNFIQEFNSINDQQRNLQVSVNATWHASDFDVSYLGGYQQFHYVLLFPTDADSGLTSFETEGLNPATNPTGAFFCAAGGFTLARCETPLKVNPAPNYTLFDEYDSSFSHEVNIASTGGSPFQYVGGLYWYHEHWNQPVDAGVEPDQPQMGAPDFVNLTTLALTPAPLNPSMAASTDNTEINYDSYAAYAQGSYKFNDQWKVTGAIRYTDDNKKGWQEWRFLAFDGTTLGNAFSSSSYGGATPAIDLTSLAVCTQAAPKCLPAQPGAGPTTINTATGFAQRTLDANWGAVTGEADIDWTPDSTLLAYAKYSRGYKSGGWSTYTLGTLPETQPEYVDAFEVGAKKSISTFTINGALFYYNYYNEQVPLTIQDTTTNQLVPILFNIPLVHDYGFEMSAFWKPIDPLTFSLSYAYLNATIAEAGPCVEDTVDPIAVQPGANTSGCKQTTPGVMVQNLKGEQIPNAIPNKVSFNTLYTFNFEPGKLTLSGTVLWQDATYDAVFNRSYNLEPPFSTVNLRATWNSADGHYTVIAFMDNVFNTVGFDGAAGVLLATSGSAEDILSDPALTAPRTFGLQLQYRWK